MNVSINTPALSMKAAAYVIKNPHETENAFTKENIIEATAALKFDGGFSVCELRSALKGYDFTSVSTNELAKIGSMLYHNGLIGEHMVDFFISGNMATDESGHQTEKNVKFNAVAMFKEMLEARQILGKSESAKGFHDITKGLLRVNHAIGALTYFANSSQGDLSINVKA
ncbi:hypothetical protein [Pseudomonas lini]